MTDASADEAYEARLAELVRSLGFRNEVVERSARALVEADRLLEAMRRHAEPAVFPGPRHNPRA